MSSQIPWQRGQSKTKVPLGPERPAPRCPYCKAVGFPSAEFTPYVACGGDPDDPDTWIVARYRHMRPPVR